MDLSERTKLKQEIVKETGYKTAINEQTLCEYNNDSEKEKYIYSHYRSLDDIK